MAVDTRQKRMSMLNFGDGTNIHTLFEADVGAVELDDRQHLLDCYSGIAFGSPVIPPIVLNHVLVKYGYVTNRGEKQYSVGMPNRVYILLGLKWKTERILT